MKFDASWNLMQRTWNNWFSWFVSVKDPASTFDNLLPVHLIFLYHSSFFIFITSLTWGHAQMMDIREAVEEASDSQALKQIESQV